MLITLACGRMRFGTRMRLLFPTRFLLDRWTSRLRSFHMRGRWLDRTRTLHFMFLRTRRGFRRSVLLRTRRSFRRGMFLRTRCSFGRGMLLRARWSFRCGMLLLNIGRSTHGLLLPGR